MSNRQAAAIGVNLEKRQPWPLSEPQFTYLGLAELQSCPKYLLHLAWQGRSDNTAEYIEP